MEAGIESPKRRILELDGLRAIAILAVMAYHYPGFDRLFGGFIAAFGWAGVDVFFVLSGFLITDILLKLKDKENAYGTFYSRRALRILPPYYLACVSILLIAAATHFSAFSPFNFFKQQLFFLQALPRYEVVTFLDILRHPRWYVLHAKPLLNLAHRLPMETIIAPTQNAAPGTYWSLSIEEYFYLLWAPVVLRLRIKGIAVTGVLICLVEMLLRYMNPVTSYNYVGLFFRLDALIYGALLALFFAKTAGRASRSFQQRLFAGTSIISMALFVAILNLLSPVAGRNVRDSPLFDVFGLPLISVASASLIGLLVLARDSSSFPTRFLRSAPLQYIGTISYTMYLTHMWAALLVLYAFAGAGLETASRASTAIQAVLATIFTIGYARLSWHYLERPVLAWKDRKIPATHLQEPALN